MDCTNCELPIEGNRYDNAIAIDRRGWREEVLHFECVDDPTQLHPEQFQKWTAWWMKHEREEREAHQEKVAADLQLIHRAPHALPKTSTRSTSTSSTASPSLRDSMAFHRCVVARRASGRCSSAANATGTAGR